MIAKGNTHDNGVRLARYLTTGKDGELAQLWELRGFALRDIADAFRSVHVMAAVGQCRQPFFHVQVRNPEGEKLTQAQWHVAVGKIETVVGLADQPRAIAVHRDAKTGHEHIHIAWSRIDPETLSARALPFFKLRLTRISRQLEEYFGLSPVPSYRNSRIAYAPKRAEEQQSRRLGVSIHDVREAIRATFENSDCGRSFRSALLALGMHLAKGERREFLAVDMAGGMHALGKRVLGVSAAEIRNRLADLSADLLPTVEQVRVFLAERQQVSSSSEPADMPGREIAAQSRIRHVKTGRHRARGEKGRAAGKRPRLNTDRIQTPTMDMVVCHDCIGPPLSVVTGVVIEVDNAPIDQLPNEASAAADEAAQREAPAPAIDGLNEQTRRPFACEEVARLQPVDQNLPQHERSSPAYNAPCHATRLKDRFRAVIKQLTARLTAPRSTPRKRRRGEIGGGFRKAAFGLLRRIAHAPPLHFLDPSWEPFTWMRLWEYNSTTRPDIQQNCSASTPPEDQPLRL